MTNYTCNVCNKQLLQKRNLKRHMESVHAGKRPFFCGPCGQKFASKQILERHMIGIHGEILNKPENLSTIEKNCNKNFANNNVLQQKSSS